MSGQRFEYYNTDDDVQISVMGVYWRAQTFTPSISHIITSVKILVLRYGSPGICTLGIRATDGDGLPIGSDLCSGTFQANDITDDAAGEWKEVDLGTGTALTLSTKYAIVARCPSGDPADNLMRWRCKSPDNGYAGGAACDSGDSGAEGSWALEPNDRDYMFEDWGDRTGPGGGGGEVYPTEAITRVTNLIHRYNRNTGVYTLEMALGEVTSDFGLPEWLTRPQAAVPEEPVSEEELVKKAVEKAAPPPLIPTLPITPPPIGTPEWMEQVVRPQLRGEPGAPAFGPTYAPETHRGYMELLAATGKTTLSQVEAELRGLKAHPLLRERFAGMTIEQYMWKYVVPKDWSGELSTREPGWEARD